MYRGNHWSTACRTAPVQAYAHATIQIVGLDTMVSVVFKTIVSNPTIWIVACAYACTGAVRQAVDQWFPRYMQELYNADLKSAQFQFLAFLIPLVASVGSL